VRLGVNVPNFGPGTDPDLLRRWALTVEGLGFDLLMVSDHVAVTPDVAEQYPAPFYEPFTTLAWLQRPPPALMPRIALQLTTAPVTSDDRLAGHGTIAQIAGDLEQLRSLGADTVVLDPFNGDPRETAHPEAAWQALATVARVWTE
jgi:hypothetical protein